MASLAIQKSNGAEPCSAIIRWELRWEPLTEPAARNADLADFDPVFEVRETTAAFLFKADLSGVDEEHLEVQLSHNRLTIAGMREWEKTGEGATFYTYERCCGSFSRTFALPPGTDAEKISAELRRGVLTVELPKAPEPPPKKILVKRGP